ncbi:MAG: zinc ribbon domain-containing protein [Bacteroidetes bacterium]|nr:zinc ribbon domain-containing protein [Bacteroidota bacterium]MBL7104112.1 zinc ribbon domain-containing protein [Bacteroidales bacterium]
MYCIECGAEIPDNSKFCPHCGKKQELGELTIKEQLAEVIIENEIKKEIVKTKQAAIDFKFLRKVVGYYLAWVVLHLGILLIFSKGIFTNGNYTDDFWPYMSSRHDGGIAEYDIKEFLVYTIFPLTIIIIISLVRKDKENKQE